MPAYNEIELLIRSRYPVVFIQTVDEPYVLEQVAEIAQRLRLTLVQWSVTEGLRRRLLKEPYEGTQEPQQALRAILSMRTTSQGSDALYVLKDFDRHLEDAVVLRLFKDLVQCVRNGRSTIVIVSAQYRLPAEIESDAAYYLGGYPNAREIADAVSDAISDFHKHESRVQIRLTDAEEATLLRALSGLTLQQVRNIVNHCLIENSIFDNAVLPKIEAYKKKIFDREGLLEFYASESSARIAGFRNLKGWIAERRMAFAAAATALPSPRGVLLMGVQGCGKSLAVKVIAGEFGLPLYRLDLIRFYSKFIGETEQNLRKALKTIDQLSPVCMWIDEIEKGFAAASDGDVDGGVSQRLLGSFLTWMQERKSSCFIAATANDIQALPPEFLRKGRFDEIFFVDLPDQRVREELFAIHLANRGLDGRRFDCRHLAELAIDFSGAEVEQAVIAALYQSKSRREQIATAHIAEELMTTKPLAVVKREEIAALREWARDRTVPA